MRPRDQWVVTTQAGCRKQRSKRLQDGGGGGAGLRSPARPPPPPDPRNKSAPRRSEVLWLVSPLDYKPRPLSPSPAPELHFPPPAPPPRFLPPEPVLANGVASCDISSAVWPSGSAQDLGPGTGENTRAADGTSSRLVNGTDCERHSRPRQGALLPGPNKLYCGAVLGDSPWLLTAARCRKQGVGGSRGGLRGFFRIRLGHHCLSRIYESGQQLFQGIKSIPHPGCSHPGHSSDLMLIKLNKRIRETPHVRPISVSSHCPSAGTSCLVSGWETTSSPQATFPRVLQCLNITVLSDDRCKTAYPNQIGDTMLCAGDQAGRDSCRGDSGGPVVCSGSLQGLVSWGDLPCTQPNRPGVYTNLCRFSKWTQDTTQSNS
ncbi:kallikrein-5 [Balaenoptera acutorostrata]|uniref:Kallikrein-5 n=1 Tax=Balaenoptera acutorostrata TaxID=9767 RepID=A0ABM3SIP3_BALAC|nr:kallikrein-5 [Balaenoptera acutorostrata]